jgi:hypothetical protein
MLTTEPKGHKVASEVLDYQVGTNQVTALYVGETKVWPAAPFAALWAPDAP